MRAVLRGQKKEQKKGPVPFFCWNPDADQPHNVALRKQRLRCHLKHAGSYVVLAASNLRRAIPVLSLYRTYRKRMYREPVRLESPFAVSVSPAEGREGEVLECLKETGVRKTLVRVPSWEGAKEKLDFYQRFFEHLHGAGFETTAALLQQREDVLCPSKWQGFVEEAFFRFRDTVEFFEVGHAWNRTKWGVWDYGEYLGLARPAASLAGKLGVRLVGPAVIDFEFHLYPAVLDAVPFHKVSSLLYVDRMGAPENRQFGWDTARKVALLKAVVDGAAGRKRDLWITEVNWPLRGTGKYSPAAGKPNVSEEEQADYLVRYYVLCLASGFVERIYWWQLVAPGYGLIDSRPVRWRKRPAFYAMKTMVSLLEGSTFVAKTAHPDRGHPAHPDSDHSDPDHDDAVHPGSNHSDPDHSAAVHPGSDHMVFYFEKEGGEFAVCWTRGGPGDCVFSRRVVRILSRDGEELPFEASRVRLTPTPRYVFFE